MHPLITFSSLFATAGGLLSFCWFVVAALSMSATYSLGVAPLEPLPTIAFSVLLMAGMTPVAMPVLRELTTKYGVVATNGKPALPMLIAAFTVMMLATASQASPTATMVLALIQVSVGVFVLVSVPELPEDESEQFNPGRPVRLAGVTIPRKFEPRNVLLVGVPGSGKSVVTAQLLSDIRERGQQAVVFDVGGAYVERFFRPGVDLILNPFDHRSQHWNPYIDCPVPYQFDTLAAAAIPEGKGSDAQWHHYSQNLFANVLRALATSGDTSIQNAIRLITTAEPAELAPVLAGTPAAILTQEGNEKMLSNTRAIISTYMTPWTYLRDYGDFSLRQWVRQAPQGQVLFVSYQDGSLVMMRQFLAALMRILIDEALSLPPDADRRAWLIADEFDSLGQVSAMRDALTKLRKFGWCSGLGIQTIAQLRDTYGREGAQVLLSCLAHRLYLRPGDRDTADWCAAEIGEHRFVRQERSESAGGLFSGSGDRETVAHRHVKENRVLGSELMQLPDLEGYLSLMSSSPKPARKVSVPRRFFETVEPAFVGREQ